MFKNALDWLVASETFAGKRVALINASPRAFHAQADLREILATMAARFGRALRARGLRDPVANRQGGHH